MWVRARGISFGIPQLNKHRNHCILKHSVLRIWKRSVIPQIRLILR